MTELRALQRRRQYLLKRLAEAADEIKKIDERLAFLLAGRRNQELELYEKREEPKPNRPDGYHESERKERSEAGPAKGSLRSQTVRQAIR